MRRNLADIQRPLEDKPVEGLHILKAFPKSEVPARYQAVDKGVEDKSIVRQGEYPSVNGRIGMVLVSVLGGFTSAGLFAPSPYPSPQGGGDSVYPSPLRTQRA